MMKWLLRRFKYVQFLRDEIKSLQEEVISLQKDRVALLNHVSKEDAQHFLNRTGWTIPDEFGWDPKGWEKYSEAVKRKKGTGERLSVRLGDLVHGSD